jgi:hypothetical protein
MICSLDLPPADEDLGWIEITLSKIARVIDWLLVISAFS